MARRGQYRQVDVYFFQGQHQDVTIGLGEVRSGEVTHDLARLPCSRWSPCAASRRACASARAAGARAIQGLAAVRLARL